MTTELRRLGRQPSVTQGPYTPPTAACVWCTRAHTAGRQAPHGASLGLTGLARRGRLTWNSCREEGSAMDEILAPWNTMTLFTATEVGAEECRQGGCWSPREGG